MLSFHGKIAALSLLPLLLWGAFRMLQNQRAADAIRTVEIGIEHTAPASLTLTHSSGSAMQFIDVQNESSEKIYVSLPEDFLRGEVKGAPLSAIVVDEPMFRFRRWHLPPSSMLSFTNAKPWRHAIIHNASEKPLRLTVITVDLGRNETTREVYLLSNEPVTVP